ncbi:MAG: FAD-binding oxidoreductase [Thaumarchaeota archaeon]|jgi:alkyldihydroxyacetonephosphate synthase|nr:FAD-binding oxidoreductase [Candidatus Geocrenenecus arthurdayi]
MSERSILKEDFLKRVKIIVGSRFTDDPRILKVYSRDFWPLLTIKESRGDELAMPLAVAWPKTVEEVTSLIKLCNEFKIPFTPYGGGSGVTGAAPCRDCLVIDVKAMNKIIELNKEDMYVTVESGIMIKKLEEYLNSKGYTIRHIPQSFPEAVVGGLIATLSTGEYSTKYGGIEDLLLDIEVVTADGGFIPLREKIVPRTSTGPNIKKLMLGSEGQLGVITKATLKIFQIPEYTSKNTFVFNSFEEALAAAREVMLLGLQPAVLRIYDKDEAALRFNEDRDLAIFIIEEWSKTLLDAKESELRMVMRKRGALEIGEEYVDSWLKKRFDVISDVVKLVVPLGLWFDTIETAATWSILPKVYREFKREVKMIKGVNSVLAHASHFYSTGGCIYFTIVFEANEEVYWRVWEKAMDTLIKNGATISHHHGIGLLRKKWIERELGESLKYLKKIKRLFDPNNISNPGKFMEWESSEA